MSLLGDWVNSKRMEDPVRGTARVVSATSPTMDTNVGDQNCKMNLVVEAPGIPATAIERNAMAPKRKWPYPGQSLPITVDRKNPDRLKIEWDDVERHDAHAGDIAERLAESMRGDPSAPATGATTQVHLGIDPSELPEDIKAQASAMGIDIEAMVAQATAASGPQPGGDDPVGRLERLAKLRDQGILSDAEFQEQKKRILGS